MNAKGVDEQAARTIYRCHSSTVGNDNVNDIKLMRSIALPSKIQ